MPTIFTVLNTSDSGLGSLRQAILEANADATATAGDPHIIQFAIPASDTGHVYYQDDGVAGRVSQSNVSPTTAADDSLISDRDPDWQHSWWSIQLERGLTISRPVVIDGYSQPGASPNTLADGDNAILRIELDGSALSNTFGNITALDVGRDSTVKGLVINRVTTTNNNFNVSAGMFINLSANGSASNVAVGGNFIGTDVSGTVALPNYHGVILQNASSIQIGGPDYADRNVISGNLQIGIGIAFGSSTGITVAGNFIGTDRTGKGPLGNEGAGVGVGRSAPHDVVIGGPDPRLGNVIAYNGTSTFLSSSAGVWIFDGSRGVTVRGNSIHDNYGLGIDLGGSLGPNEPLPFSPGPNGVTLNDSGDGDGGTNNQQNFPEITAAQLGTTITVSGTLNSSPNSQFTVDFYASPDADSVVQPDGKRYGEGKYYLGSTDVTTDASGNATFTNVSLPTTGIQNDVVRYLAATATDVSLYDHDNNPSTPDIQRNNTSEFSAAYQFDDLAVFGTSGDDDIVLEQGSSTGTVKITVNSPVNSTVYDDQSVAGQVLLLGGAGNDDYTVKLGGWNGTVTVADSGATSATDTLLVSGTPGDDIINKTATQVTWGNPVTETVNYSGIESLTVAGGTGNDTITDPGPTNTTILGGPGTDTILIANISGSVVADGGEDSDTYVVQLGALDGPVTITDSGTTGTTTVRILGTEADDQMLLSASALTAGSETINLNLGGSPVELVLDGEAGEDHVTVEGAVAPGVTLTLVSLAQTIQIDVRPESVNLSNNGLIPVVVFSTAGFDATQADVSSVLFAGAAAYLSALEDVDGDGDLDRVLHFRTQDTNLRQLYEQLLEEDADADGVLDSTRQEAQVSLTGQTVNDLAFEGFDAVNLFLSGKALRDFLNDLASQGVI